MCLFDIERRERESDRERDVKTEQGKPRHRQGKIGRVTLGPGASQGNGKASLAMSCLTSPGESLLSIERITRLIPSLERRRECTA